MGESEARHERHARGGKKHEKAPMNPDSWHVASVAPRGREGETSLTGNGLYERNLSFLDAFDGPGL